MIRGSLLRAMLGFVLALGLAFPAFAAFEVIGKDQEPVEMEVHRGTLVRLPAPATAVFIADPEIADVAIKSPTLVHITAKRAGETSLFAVNANEDVLADVRIVVTHNLTSLQTAISTLLPNSVIEIDSIAGSLILKGVVETAAEAEEAQRLAAQFIDGENETIINQLDLIGPNQVNLRVRVVEVGRQVLKQLNFNFDALASVSDFTFGLSSASPLISVGDRFNDASVNFNNGDVNVDAVIDALEEEGLATLLAEPNLTAMSGETAKFLAGGEFPIPIAEEDDRITVEFKEFGVSLAFTPTILGSSRMNLRVAPEVSELSTNGAITIGSLTLPALSTRRADTTVELASGQSLAIAGLLQNNTNQEIAEYPGLAELPILGALFRSSSFKNQETELVIIVTPYLVRPASAIALASPTDGFAPASDIDRTMSGRNYRQTTKTAPPTLRTSAFAGHTGPLGFTLE